MSKGSYHLWNMVVEIGGHQGGVGFGWLAGKDQALFQVSTDVNRKQYKGSGQVVRTADRFRISKMTGPKVCRGVLGRGIVPQNPANRKVGTSRFLLAHEFLKLWVWEPFNPG